MSYFSNIPEQLKQKRDIIEGNFIFCLWKDPDLYSLYDKNIHTGLGSDMKKEDRPPTFMMKESIFYYSVGLAMYNQGYTDFDEVSVMLFLDDKENLKRVFDEYGGYETIEVGTSVVNTSNVDVYFDELAKSNILINLYRKGFSVMEDYDKLKLMTAEQIDDYYDYMLNEAMINNASYIDIQDLVIDESFIKAMEEGLDIGLQYNKTCKILNYITMGIPKGDLFLLGGHSGTGKAQPLYSKILTPNGYVKMGDIDVGDDIYGEDGKVYKVSSIHPQGLKDAYRVTFTDGGSTVTCDEHLWTVHSDTKGWETVELKDIINNDISKYAVPVFKEKDKLRRFDTIEYIGKEEMQCITTTNPTKLYITDDMIVTHNSSFAFANIVIPVVENGHKACIISNEQGIRDFQVMLAAMTMANDMKYFGLTRKKIKAWQLNDEQKAKFREAMEIVNKKYLNNLKFVRMFDYDNAKIGRVIRRLSKQGFELFMYDTFKSEGSADDWAKLINDSRELFQLVSKEDVAMVTTYQLAPGRINKRYLDVSTLANAKQIKEVYSEMIYFREVWDDEFDGEKYDIQPYQMKQDASGRYTGEKEFIKLDRDKKYIILFVDKTRNDEDGQTLVYEFNGRFNIWKEIGFCKVHYDRY